MSGCRPDLADGVRECWTPVGQGRGSKSHFSARPLSSALIADLALRPSRSSLASPPLYFFFAWPYVMCQCFLKKILSQCFCSFSVERDKKFIFVLGSHRQLKVYRHQTSNNEVFILHNAFSCRFIFKFIQGNGDYLDSTKIQ